MRVCRVFVTLFCVVFLLYTEAVNASVLQLDEAKSTINEDELERGVALFTSLSIAFQLDDKIESLRLSTSQPTDQVYFDSLSGISVVDNEVYLVSEKVALIHGYNDDLSDEFKITFESNATKNQKELIVNSIYIQNPEAKSGYRKLKLEAYKGSDLHAFTNTIEFNNIAKPFLSINEQDVSSMISVDIDNDSNKEIIFNNSEGNLHVYKVVDPTYPINYEYSEITHQSFLEVEAAVNARPNFIDFDNDGDLDLFISNASNSLNYYKNIGDKFTPSYKKQTNFDNPFYGRKFDSSVELHFYDFDGDDDLDAIATDENGKVSYLRYQSSELSSDYKLLFGTLNPFYDISEVLFSNSYISDINSDGLIDLIDVNDIGIGTVYFGFKRNNVLYFSPDKQIFNIDIGQNSPTKSLSLVDIDHDGRKDLIVSNHNGEILYYQNWSHYYLEIQEVNDKPTITAQSTYLLNENTMSVAHIVAQDEEDNNVELSLSGNDAQSFILTDNNVLEFVSSPNFEQPHDTNQDNTYEVIITATDSGLEQTSFTTEIRISDVNEAPIIAFNPTYDVIENQFLVAEGSITNPELNEVYTISLAGDDADLFVLENDQLTFKNAPDYELPSDMDQNNEYRLVIEAIDVAGNEQSLDVLVKVINTIEPVAIYGLNDIVFSESDITNGSYQAMFANINLSDLGDDWSEQTLTIRGLQSSDSLTFMDHDDFIFVENSIVYDGNLIAEIELGEHVQITFTGHATSSIVNQLIKLVAFSMHSTMTDQVRYLTVTLSHVNQGPIKLINNISFSQQSWLNLESIDVGENASPVIASLYSDMEPQLVIGELFNQLNLLVIDGDSPTKYVDNQLSSNLFRSLSSHYGIHPVLYDYDGDGDLDLLVGNSSGQLRAYDNIGTSLEPSFIESQSLVFSMLDVGKFSAPHLADLNKDGELDLLIGNEAGQVLLLENINQHDLGSLTLEHFDTLIDPSQISGNAKPFVVDIDTDGHNDLVVGESSGLIKYFRFDESTNVYTLVNEAENPFLNIETVGHATPYFYDADLDGDLDLFIGSQDGKISFYQNDAGVLISIIDENTPPSLEVDNVNQVAELNTFVTDIIVTDFEQETVSLSLSGVDADNFFITSDGQLRFTQPPSVANPMDSDGNNVYQVIITAVDEMGAETKVETEVQVVNEIIISPTDISEWRHEEGSSYLFTINTTDSVGIFGTDAAQFKVINQSVRFVNIPNYELPTDDDKSNDYRLDLVVGKETFPIVITVQDVNESPIISTSNQFEVEENQIFSVPVSVTDPEGQELNISIAGHDSDFFEWAESNMLVMTQAMNFEQPTDHNADSIYEIIINVEDHLGLSIQQQVSVKVTNVDELTQVMGIQMTMFENEGFVTQVLNEQIDLGAYHFELIGQDAHLFEIDGFGQINFVSVPDFEAPADADLNNKYEFSVSIAAVSGEHTSIQVQVTINDLFELPAIKADAEYTVMEGNNLVGEISINNALSTTQILLSGKDSHLFEIVNSRLGFIQSPNFEQPLDHNQDGLYEITLSLTDSEDTADIIVSVVDADEVASVDGSVNSAIYVNSVNNGSNVLFSNVSVFDPENDFNNNRLTISGVDNTELLTLYENESSSLYVDDISGDILVNNQVVGTIIAGLNNQEVQGFVIEFNEFASSKDVETILSAIKLSSEREGDFSDIYQVTLTNSSGDIQHIFNEDNFSVANQIIIPEASNELMNPTIIDLNDDGELELVFGSNQGTLYHYNLTNDELIINENQLFVNVYPGLFSAPKFVDLDNDKDLDLVIGNSDGYIMYYENQGDMKQAEFVWQDLTNPFAGIDVGSQANPTMVDFDEDGDIDSIVTNHSGQLVLLENIGSVYLPKYQKLQINTANIETLIPGFKMNIAFRDLNSDGKLDAYVGNEYGDIFTFEHMGTNNAFPYDYNNELNNFADFNFEQGAYLIVADYHQDGDDDVWVLNGLGELYFFENNAGFKVNVKIDSLVENFNVKLSSVYETESGSNVIISPEIDNDQSIPLTYKWKQTNGVSVSIVDESSPTLDFLAPVVKEQSTLSFELTVSSQSSFVKKEVEVVVVASNIDISIDLPVKVTVLENDEVTIDTLIEQNSGLQETILWSQTEGIPVSINDVEASSLSFLAPQVDTDTALEFTVTVTVANVSAQKHIIVIVQNDQTNSQGDDSGSIIDEEEQKTEVANTPIELVFMLILIWLARVRSTRPNY